MIRYFSEQDRNAFYEMADAFYHLPAVLHPVPQGHFETTFNTILEGSPYTAGMIAEIDGVHAGYALVSLTYSNEVAGLVLWIEEMYVKESYRSHGVGQAFFSFIDKEYGNKVKRYRLEVTGENTRAIALYKRLGYQMLDYRQMVRDL